METGSHHLATCSAITLLYIEPPSYSYVGKKETLEKVTDCGIKQADSTNKRLYY